MTKKCVEWLNNNRNSSPRLVYDLEKVKENFSQFIKLFGVIKPYYAVKANPSGKIVALLNKLGSNFDCASINEIKICTEFYHSFDVQIILLINHEPEQHSAYDLQV